MKNKHNIIENIRKIFKKIQSSSTPVINDKFKLKTIIKLLRKPIRRTRRAARKFFRTVKFTIKSIKLVSIRKILGEANIDFFEIVDEIKHRIKRIKLIIKTAIGVFFEIPPIIKEDFKKYTIHIKSCAHKVVSTCTNIYIKIPKNIYVKFAALKNYIYKIYINRGWQTILSNLQEIIISTMDLLLYIAHTIYVILHRLILNKKVVLTIELIFILVVAILVLSI